MPSYIPIREAKKADVMPCPGCGVNDSVDCGYLIYENGDYDCEAPDNEEGELCDYCHHLYCSKCAFKYEMNFQKEEFDV